MPTVSMPPTGDAPTAITQPNRTPTGGAPTGITLDATAPTGAAPAARALAAMAPTGAAPTGIAGETFAPNATPPTGIALAPSNPTANAPASVPGISYQPNIEAPRLVSYVPPLAPLTDINVNTPTLSIEGALVLNRIYGYTRMPVASRIERVQVQLQEAPVGGPSTITLVDSNGTSLGVEVTVAAGETFGETVPGTPLALLADANVRAKCTAVAPTKPGGFGAVTLFARVTT